MAESSRDGAAAASMLSQKKCKLEEECEEEEDSLEGLVKLLTSADLDNSTPVSKASQTANKVPKGTWMMMAVEEG